MENETFQYIPWLTGRWDKIGGYQPTMESVILDLGCGVGSCVDQFRKAGYNKFYGCDFLRSFPEKIDYGLKQNMEDGVIRVIRETPYRLPFEDGSFDMVFSLQVFEHVMDYDATLAEIRRVLKPNGVSVHVFPGRWRWKECHTYIPWAGVFNNYWYLKFWAITGIRNEYQSGLSASETARRNWDYLLKQTNYLSRSNIRKHVMKYFGDCLFVEEAYFGNINKPWMCWVVEHLAGFRAMWYAWFSDTDMRVLVFHKTKPNRDR